MATGARPSARAAVQPARPEPAPPSKETAPARADNNAWWCPWDDRAMQHKDPCDVCGAVFHQGRATRPI